MIYLQVMNEFFMLSVVAIEHLQFRSFPLPALIGSCAEAFSAFFTYFHLDMHSTDGRELISYVSQHFDVFVVFKNLC